MNDDVKKLFKELLEGYVEDFLENPKSFVNSPKEMKDEVALLIKGGRVVDLDVAKMIADHGEKKG